MDPHALQPCMLAFSIHACMLVNDLQRPVSLHFTDPYNYSAQNLAYILESCIYIAAHQTVSSQLVYVHAHVLFLDQLANNYIDVHSRFTACSQHMHACTESDLVSTQYIPPCYLYKVGNPSVHFFTNLRYLVHAPEKPYLPVQHIIFMVQWLVHMH